MNDSPKRDVEIFNKALQLAVGERNAYLEKACGSDLGLLKKVEKLLKAHDLVGDFMEQSPQNGAAQARLEISVGEKPGDLIGRYKLLEQIGEGGCGVVFMAEQTEPLRRRVALKIIKPGMDTKNVIARFEAERQALALMDHPNIAKVFEAGTTESGRPYFVMELVRGFKITEYCDGNSLTLEERLELFIQICQAIQHAHQKGIIHRDIKPSNILVTKTLQDEALPVVIDFGIAKATTNQPLTNKTLFTAFEMLLGTPAYMSPEQAAFTVIDVDTRSDIYSLGVLLYELLTGSAPFSTEDLAKAGIEETRRVIREKEPLRPSVRLSKMADADLTVVALRNKSDPPKFIRAICGDLDWIVMKAIEKDRTRRYETANGLGLDVRRFLANEPVSARPPSRLYKFQKLVRRNKLLFSSVAVIAALFVVGFIVISISLAREKQAKQVARTALREMEAQKNRAQANAAESQEIKDFLEDMLKGVGPSVAHGKDTAVLREILDRTDEQISTALTNQPKVEAEIRNLIGGLYLDIGNYDRAESSLRAAAAIDRKLYGVESAQAAKSRHELSVAFFKQGKLAEAESTELEALAIRRRFFGNENEDVAISLCNLADVYRLQRRVDEALGLTQEALRIRQKLFGDDSLQAANSLRSLCILLGDKGERPESAAMAEKVLAIRIKHLGTNDLLVAASLDDLAWADDYVGKLKEVESLELEALEIRRKLLGDVHPDVASSLSYLGQFMRNQGKLSDSDAVLSATYAIQCKLEGENNPQTLYTLDALGATLNKEGKWTKAKTVFNKSLSAWRKQQGNNGPRALWALQGLVDALVGEKKYDEAATALSEVLTPEYIKEPASADLLWKEADLLGQQGKWQEALTNAAFLLKYQPNDEYGYHVCCGLLAITRNTLAYQQLCQRILETFTNSTTPYLAERVADDGLLLPGSGADLRVLDKWATDAVVLGKNSPDHGYFEACKAFSDYRSGRFPESVTWAEKSLGTSAAFAKAKAYAVLAMARWQLGQADAAREALAQGNELAPPISAPGKAVYLGSSWVAWIFARVTLDEATELIAPASNTANRSNGTQ